MHTKNFSYVENDVYHHVGIVFYGVQVYMAHAKFVCMEAGKTPIMVDKIAYIHSEMNYDAIIASSRSRIARKNNAKKRKLIEFEITTKQSSKSMSHR